MALLKDRLPADVQTSRRGLLVDEHLRVRGSRGTIYCLGDAAVTGDTPATALPPTAQVSSCRARGVKKNVTHVVGCEVAVQTLQFQQLG